ncbi:ephrin type-B receptor 1 isoform X9 [Vespula pensylvanica]|uniref:ephrin type-B receptor 1 isoform X9 n=1 Tax=Vespula pensylvanica TaxID=30213 RepID=UPI001CB9E063|nr:ephrin type-B receptor 1 isoform X9 [Vespula pensylvanica]XP_050855270.1 ephrin type-B receptor 1 isoform X5 [Vespula vulgaris]
MAPFFAASTLAGALRPLLALLLALLIGCPRAIHAEQVVLLDTTTEAKLEWTRYPYGPQASTPGWVEESFTNFDKGINWRSYVVCDVAYNNVNNWLWTPFIERGPANRMYIEIKFTTRDCSLFPGNALSCKETFSLLYYEFDAATKEPPPWEPDSYKLIGRIAAGEGRFNTNTEVVINTEIKSVPVTKKGVYFAFRDQGACISLLAIKVYYISCPEISVNFAHFPATPTGREVALVEQTIGTCVANAVKIETPTFLCKGDGKWYLPSGGCHCKPGYQADVEKQQCIECPIGRFKHEAGPHSCELCPTHSKSTDQAVTECRCDADYYRAADDPKKMPCTQPPSAPQNLTVNFVDQSTVILSWNAPHKLGGRTDTTYRVVCDACSMGVKYIPNTEIFNDTKITITGLNAVTTYRFQVFAENGVSAQAGKSEYVDITVTTEASVPSLVSNVRITSVKSSELSISWDAPVTEVGGDSDHVERYEVRCYPRFDDAINATVIQTSDLSATFKGLKPATDYAIQVRAKTTRGWGEYTPVIYKKTPHAMGLDYVGEDDNMQVRIIAGAVVAVVVLLVIIIVMTVLFLRSRASDECNKKQPSDCDTLEYRNGEGLVVTYMHCKMDSSPIVTTHTNNKSKSSLTTPLFTPAVGVTGAGAGGTGGTGARSYVDPHTYEDPNQAVREFAREIDAGYITIEAIIGGGEFGDVCRGKLKLPPDGRTEIDVAIKTLKPGSADKARNDFLTEASIMGQFEHPNVIFLQGVVTKSNPVMIITEFMENGSLDTFLRANDGKFQVLQLVGMLRGIASGMQYLAEMNYVHRDLAARNVLVNAALVCKIADFGLSREIESATEGAYTTRGGKIPVRWTAPEAIAFRKFTSASDVWSMGIVCWEVMSYGERPYWNWSNQDVIKSIEKGYRLPAPMDCPEAIYQLMLDCWQKERTHRPTFANLTQTLDKLIRSPDTLRKIAQNSVRPPAHNPYYVTSHTAAAQAAAAAAAAAATAAATAASAAAPVPGAPTTGPFPVDVVGHQAHQAQSTIAVPVMPPGAARSLHYHTHAATHALPHQPPLTYPNWVPFTHFG